MVASLTRMLLAYQALSKIKLARCSSPDTPERSYPSIPTSPLYKTSSSVMILSSTDKLCKPHTVERKMATVTFLILSSSLSSILYPCSSD